ncbi:MAG: hypothetical protein ABI040_01935 [Rhodoferax sp.]
MPLGTLPPRIMNENICFQIELSQQPVVAIVCANTLCAGFASDEVPNDAASTGVTLMTHDHIRPACLIAA